MFTPFRVSDTFHSEVIDSSILLHFEENLGETWQTVFILIQLKFTYLKLLLFKDFGYTMDAQWSKFGQNHLL